jgi:hypothetical protein
VRHRFRQPRATISLKDETLSILEFRDIDLAARQPEESSLDKMSPPRLAAHL